MAGDPINTSTGNKYLQDDDYLGNAWLIFRRFYNSHAAAASSAMGAHWRHSFDRSLELLGTPAASAVMFRPDGKQETFSKTNDIWTADPDIPDTLVENDDAQGVATSYTVFVAALRHFETYDTNGLLQAVRDEAGLGIDLTYSTTLTDPAVAPKPGLLLTVTDLRGRQLHFTYDSNGLVHQVTLPDSGTLTYAYDATGNLTSVQYPDTKTRQYVYNESGLTGGANLPNAMTGIVDEAGVRYEDTTFDSSGRATSSSFAGHVGTTQITYNSDGTSSVQYPLGFSSTLGFSVEQGLVKVASLDQPCGPQCGQPWKTRTYDANGYPASYTDFKATVTNTTYDANGLLDEQVDAVGTSEQRTTTMTWSISARVPLTRTVKDATGAAITKTAWIYNTRQQPTARCEIDPAKAPSYVCATSGTLPAGVRRWNYFYCESVSTYCPIVGLFYAVNGPRTDIEDVTRYYYYGSTDESGCGTVGGACHYLGDLYYTTNALGQQTVYVSYDKNGRVTRLKDVSGRITDFAYSPRGWLTQKIVRASGTGTPMATDATTTLAYDPTGTVHQVTDPDGVTTTYTYDGAHRLTDITDATGNRIHYTLDAAGNKTKEETFDASGTVRRSLSRSYNTLGQLTAITDGLSHTVFDAGYGDSYDGNGNLVHSADAKGIQRQQGFDALNRLVGTIENYNGTDTATKDTQSVFSYDALDRLDGVSDPDGLVTSYDYDGLNNLKALHSPDTGDTAYGYDAGGNRTGQTDARGVTSGRTYDALGRLTGVTYPDSTLDITYAYDEADSVTGCSGTRSKGRLTRVAENGGGTVFCYDIRGNVLTKQVTLNGQTDTTQYTWTSADRLASVRSANNTLTTYTRDANGRITKITAHPPGAASTVVVSNVRYLPFGPIVAYTLGNGQTITRTYDANYALTDITSPAFHWHAARDVMGNIAALGNAPGASPATETYDYDPLYRLTAIKNSTGTAIEAYTYNKTGDRLNKTASGLMTGAYTYQTGTHRLTGVGTTTRQVDANGNTTANVMASGAWGYGYNDRNRMSVVQQGGATVGSYVYDAFGERISKTVGTTVTRFDYNEGSRLLSESQGTASSRDYVWMDDLPVAIADNTTASGTTASTFNYVYADGLGTPRVVANPGGTVLWQWAYQGNAFGEQPPTTTGGYVLNLRFPGQYFDAESNLAYNVNRNYEAALGRYLQSDLIGLYGGSSTYAYVKNNALRLRDSSGLQSVPAEPPVQEGAEGGNSSAYDSTMEGLRQDAELSLELSQSTSTDPATTQPVLRPPSSQYGPGGSCRPDDFDRPQENVGPSNPGPDFIVTPDGTTFPVPSGATGPEPANNGRGMQFQNGSGGNGLDPRVTGFRMMDPNSRNPNGYGSYNNMNGQTVDPYTGRTLQPSDPMWHIQ